MVGRQLLCILKKICVLHVDKIIMLKILPKEEVVEEEVGADTLKEKSLIFIAYVAIDMYHMMHPHASWLGIELSRK